MSISYQSLYKPLEKDFKIKKELNLLFASIASCNFNMETEQLHIIVLYILKITSFFKILKILKLSET